VNQIAALALRKCVIDPDRRFSQHLPIIIHLDIPDFDAPITKMQYEPTIDTQACRKLDPDEADALAQQTQMPKLMSWNPFAWRLSVVCLVVKAGGQLKTAVCTHLFRTKPYAAKHVSIHWSL
jgi:hypothetical protein